LSASVVSLRKYLISNGKSVRVETATFKYLWLIINNMFAQLVK